MARRLNRRDVLKGSVVLPAVANLASRRQPAPPVVAPRGLPDIIRVAIIGLEGHYSEILESTKVIPQIRVTAIAESDLTRAGRASRNPLLKDAKIYPDYGTLLDREKLDVVAVCGENGPRATIVQACAAKKLPIVSEKPLCLTLDELDKTRAAIQAAGVPLTMLVPMRFYPPYQKMREIVRSGEIGEVVSMAAQKSYKLGQRPDWMKSLSSYGGTIPYIGIHMVDLMRYVGGRDFVEVAAFQSTVGFPEIREMENNAVAAFRLDNRGTASLRLDYLRPETAPTHGDDRLRIAGTKGIVEYQGQTGVTLMTAEGKPEVFTELPAEKRLFVDFLQELYAGGVHAIRPEEIYRVNAIVLKAREAAETGRVVKL